MIRPSQLTAGSPANCLARPQPKGECETTSLRKAGFALLLLSATALAGCATMQKPPEIAYDDAAPAVQTVDPPAPVTVVELPRPLPLPGQMKPVERSRQVPEPTDPASRVNQANAAARIQPVRNGFINAMQVYPFTSGALYQVYTAVGQITDIALQPGETLVGSGPVAAGDTVRWIIGDTLSGSGVTQQVHILVKPTRPELMTNLVINSNLRTYHMELRSTERTYMASVSWQYPQDQLIALRRQNQQAEVAQPVASGVDLANVNFRYVIEGDRAPWRPLRAFDDGRQVFIEFPRGIAQGEMPPLFVVGPEGDTSELVNYRVRGRHMIVDRLFAAAELRFGTGDNQKRVRITRTDGRPAS
jgi:type IV secretion system protein VirB9